LRWDLKGGGVNFGSERPLMQQRENSEEVEQKAQLHCH